MYQEYCAGHDEALAVIRNVEFSPEWLAYERRCSSLAAARERPSLATLLKSSQTPEFNWTSRSGADLARAVSSGDLTVRDGPHIRDGPPRLMLRDLLIKPIQRICRYPLVLASLLGSQADYVKKAGEVEVGEDLESALGVMRVAAEGVDEATRRKASTHRTKLILQRMELHTVSTKQSCSCSFVSSIEPHVLMPGVC